MFGYILSKQFGESKIWDYASVTVYEETGFDLKRYRGKVFQKDIINVVQDLSVGDQVEFEIKRTERGDHRYTEFTKITPTKFSSCNKCGKKDHEDECTGVETSEKLEGAFDVVSAELYNDYVKLVLRGDEKQFTFIHWKNSEFVESFYLGDRVKVCGWRSENRITKLRVFQKTDKKL